MDTRHDHFTPTDPEQDNRLRECAGMVLDEDELLRSDPEVERFLRSVAPGS